MPTKTLEELQKRAKRMLPQKGDVGAIARRKLSPLFNRERSQMSRGPARRYPFTPTRSAQRPEITPPPRPAGRVATSPAIPAPTGGGRGRAAPLSMAGAPSGLGGLRPGPRRPSPTNSISRAVQLSESLPLDLQRGLEISALAKALGRVMKEGDLGAI